MSIIYDALFSAAIAGNSAATTILEIGVDECDEEGRTVLHTEADEGNTEHVRFILRKFANKNLLVKLTNAKHTALHLAAYRGRTEVAEVLIDAARHLPPSSAIDHPVSSFQAFLRQGDKDMDTALHAAIKYNYVDIVKLLVDADPSDRHIVNDKGESPLYRAVHNGYYDVVKVICKTCTAPSLDGPGGTTALHAAIDNIRNQKDVTEEDKDVIRMLIDAAKRRSNSEDAPHESLEAFFQRTDESGRTVLELAMDINHVDAVEMILLEDPAYQPGPESNKNGLMRLIYKAIDMEYSNDIVNLLSQTYEAGISTGHKGVVALILAIKKRDKESVLRLLKDNKHLASFADDQGWTPLHYAAYHEFDSILNAIIDVQKSVGYKFVYGDMVETPFHVAAERGYTSTVIRLMQIWPPSSSSAYTAVNKNGRNVLHLAAAQNKKEMIQDIFKYCHEKYKDKILNEQDANGDTPLHLLISNGCFIPELITHKGLDTMLKNKKNLTLRDMLYCEDEIIGDQVKIKIVLDEVQTNQKTDILESSVLPSKRETKDAMFNKHTKLSMVEMKEDLERYKKTRAVSHWFADAIAGDANARAALEMEAERQNEEGETTLHVESRKGDTEHVRFIVMEFANKNLLVKLDRLKQTALHVAAHHGHTQVVEVLIHAAKHLPSSSANDHTHNPVSSFQAFIRQATGATGNTALHIAVLNGNMAIVKLLVEADPSDTHIQNYEGKTPIYIAAENGYKGIIEVICTTCTAQSLEGPGGSTTTLHALIKNIHQGTEEARDAIRIIINAAKRWSSAAGVSHVSFEALFNRTDESGSTVLQLAVERNYLDVVKLILLEDPAYQHGRGSKKNSLMRLIYKAIDKESSKDIVQLLSETYEAGISPDHKGVLDLILAIKRRDKESALHLLTDAKHLVTFAEDEGWTPLHYAAYHEFVSILDAIIEAQKAVEYKFVYGDMVSTPLHVAAEY